MLFPFLECFYGFYYQLKSDFFERLNFGISSRTEDKNTFLWNLFGLKVRPIRVQIDNKVCVVHERQYIIIFAKSFRIQSINVGSNKMLLHYQQIHVHEGGGGSVRVPMSYDMFFLFPKIVETQDGKIYLLKNFLPILS